MTNHQRVGKALELLKTGLGPFVEREMKATGAEVHGGYAQDPVLANKSISEWDVAGLLKLMWDRWNEVFRNVLGHAERSLVSEIRGHRNSWAHQESFSSDDAYRVLDSASRLLAAVSAPESKDLENLKMELLRVRFEEQARTRRRKHADDKEGVATTRLKPWREIITPHKDVANGRYQQAEFAADLWQVHMEKAEGEYQDPVEFFRRTYLTESLKSLLAGAISRLSGEGGDPVVQLQTNFGGGKTHSMLALYHLFSGAVPGELGSGIEDILQEAGKEKLPTARRVVLVGNKISPGNPVTKPDGTIVRTLWGELAWQLGGKEAFGRIEADDEKATNPGDVLRELFEEYGPCLILIDEWVAYARQLHDQSEILLPAGSFETQFSFAQALTESAKAANNCLLVISLPASDTAGSPHTQADDVEVGGQRGREALDRLRNVVGRIESSWRPASAEESFEIVRRRLFEPFLNPEQNLMERDVIAREFADLYRGQSQEFPPGCKDADYEKRIRAAYPVHPEIFDRLYTDWSTLLKFQRTRGVLRLMAAVICSLWERGDKDPLIMPANVSIDDPRVKFELTRYLPDNWTPVIEKDVDGSNSLPFRIDGEVPNLGKIFACRRVARVIYLGSAPIADAAHKGIEERQIKLGCVMPGESPSLFGDALRRLAGAATYLYQDGSRYWYSTQPTVTKLAEDRAEQLKRDHDKGVEELGSRLKTDLRRKGNFGRIHVLPYSGQDVPDDMDARLVVLSDEQHYSKGEESPAETVAKDILKSRGNSPRIYQNALVFLAPDKTKLQDLDDAIRKYLAWESILEDRNELDLSPYQVRQAETQKDAASKTVTARLPETYQWLLVPMQSGSGEPVELQATRLSGQDALAARASKKLKNDELLITDFAPSRLRMELDRVPLWRGDHVSVRQVVEDFAKYLYLPRLTDSSVLLKAIKDGLGRLTWEQDSFGFAEGYDDVNKRYQALRAGEIIELPEAASQSLLVKPDVARKQLDVEVPKPEQEPSPDPDPVPPSPDKKLTRFHGAVRLDPTRAGRDASQIADEIISHLEGLVGAKVTVTLEIEAEVESGVPDRVVRTVTENSRTLKFSSHGFEKE